MNSGTGTVVVTVNGVPETVDDSYLVPSLGMLQTTDANGMQTPQLNDNGLLANDFVANGNLTARLVQGPAYGPLLLAADGTFKYTRTGTVALNDSFTYEAVDARGAVSRVTTVSLIRQALHQNPISYLDVNADGHLSPLDVLLIINFMNSYPGGDGSVVGLAAPPPYYDVNGDGFISPLDALLVINWYNSGGGG